MKQQMEQQYVQYMYSYPHKTAYRTLQGVDLQQAFAQQNEVPNSLYFHIPFCQYKCGYCNLFSVAGESEKEMRDYVDAMERQAEQLAGILPGQVTFSDLTIGGGTPLALPEPLLERIFYIAKTYFHFTDSTPDIVVETSPNQTTEAKIALLKEQGVTRVSMGVQSFQEEELKMLCRAHTSDAARKAISCIRQGAFDCVNLDLIYGIPGQDLAHFRASLEEAVSYVPEELFIYPLYVKPGTELYRQGKAPSSNRNELYCFARDYLKKEGYGYTSMRRFYRRKEGKVILPPSCGFENTLSIGCGGRSYIGNLHFCTPYTVKQANCRRRLQEYCKQKDFLQVTNGFLLSEEEQRRRYVIKNLFCTSGIAFSGYKRQFGSEVLQDYTMLEQWIGQGYVVQNDRGIYLSEKGFAYADALGPMLISEPVAKRMRAWRDPYEAE